MVTHDNQSLIARYEELRHQFVALERAGKWNCDEAAVLDDELVELERLLPEGYVHPDDEWIETSP